jgi:hypothetical protein
MDAYGVPTEYKNIELGAFFTGQYATALPGNFEKIACDNTQAEASHLGGICPIL